MVRRLAVVAVLIAACGEDGIEPLPPVQPPPEPAVVAPVKVPVDVVIENTTAHERSIKFDSASRLVYGQPSEAEWRKTVTVGPRTTLTIPAVYEASDGAWVYFSAWLPMLENPQWGSGRGFDWEAHGPRYICTMQLVDDAAPNSLKDLRCGPSAGTDGQMVR